MHFAHELEKTLSVTCDYASFQTQIEEMMLFTARKTHKQDSWSNNKFCETQDVFLGYTYLSK